MIANQDTFPSYKTITLVWSDGGRLTPLFETPLTYSQGRRAYRLRYGDDYGYGSYLRERGSNGFLEFKRGRRVVFGDKKCCWIGGPGFEVPSDDVLRYLKRNLRNIHYHPIYAFEQYIKGIGAVLFSMVVHGTMIWLVKIPGLDDLILIIFRQHNCARVHACHVRKPIEAMVRYLDECVLLSRDEFDQKIRAAIRESKERSKNRDGGPHAEITEILGRGQEGSRGGAEGRGRGGGEVSPDHLRGPRYIGNDASIKDSDWFETADEYEPIEVERSKNRDGGPHAEMPVRKRIHVIILAPDVDKKDIRSKFPVEVFHIQTPLYVPDFSCDYMEQQHYPDCVTDIRLLYDRIHESALIFFTWYVQRILGPNWGWILRRRGVDFRLHSNIVDSANPHTRKIQEQLEQIYKIALEDPRWHVRLTWFIGDETRYRVKSEEEYWLQFNSTGKPPPV